MARNTSAGRAYQSTKKRQLNNRTSSRRPVTATGGRKASGNGRKKQAVKRTAKSARTGNLVLVNSKKTRPTAQKSSINRKKGAAPKGTQKKTTGRVSFTERMEARESVLPVKAHAMDYKLLFLVLFLFGFGLIMIYSTSSYSASLKYNDPAFFLKTQLKNGLLGVVLMLVVSMLPYKLIRDTKWITFVVYFGTVGLLIWTLAFGNEVKGAKRWIDIGGISLQSSEVAKWGLILFLAGVAYYYTEELKTWLGILIAFVFAALIIGLVGVEDLSTAVILLGITVSMLFVSTPLLAPFLVVGGIGAAGFGVLMKMSPYRFERVATWRNLYNSEKGLQTLQGLYAIGSGGLFGKGLGQSMQKMGFVPESHNDMIFSIITEELGLFGAISVIVIFLFMIIRIVSIVRNASDIYGSMIGVGVLTHIGLQTFVNIAVVTNTIPNTGVPLPFISYGGTSVAILMMEMGTVLAVSRYTRLKNRRKAGDRKR